MEETEKVETLEEVEVLKENKKDKKKNKELEKLQEEKNSLSDKLLRVSAEMQNMKRWYEEEISRIWNRFYKVDESRQRTKGGSGIGLSLVKAVMNKYENQFGVENKENGVEFYFEIGYSIISDQM